MKRRNTRKIKAWMARKGLTGRELAARADASESHTSDTLHGRRDHRRVLRVLLEGGCPERWLDLPEDMQSEKAA